MSDELRVRLEARPTEDLQRILEDRNADEWRPEVFPIVEAFLRARGAARHTARPHDAAVSPPGVEIGPVMPESEGREWLSILLSGGIDAWISEQPFDSVHGHCIGIQLHVRPEDAAAADEMLSGYADAPPIFPEDLAPPPCPKCKTPGAKQSLHEEELPPDPLFEVRQVVRSWCFSCENCGHYWLDDGR